MEERSHNFFASKASIVGLFSVLTVVLTIPLAVVVTQQPQSFRGSASEPTATPTSMTLKEMLISGYVYHDQNHDGQRNTGEKPFSGVVIKLNELKRNEIASSKIPNSAIEIKTDSFGYFKFTLPNTTPDSQEYIIKMVLPNGYKTITTNPVILSRLHKDARQIVEFGLFPLSATTPTSIVTPTCILRPACLDATPACKLPEPAQGWCPTKPTALPSQTNSFIKGD